MKRRIGALTRLFACSLAIHPSDVVWFSPNEKHWHGASSTKAMSHIAIHEELNGEVVTWLEKVSDSDYSKSTYENS